MPKKRVGQFSGKISGMISLNKLINMKATKAKAAVEEAVPKQAAHESKADILEEEVPTHCRRAAAKEEVPKRQSAKCRREAPSAWQRRRRQRPA